jgi:penicillin-binding protein 1A
MRHLLRFFGFLFTLGAILFVLGAAATGVVVWKYSQELPDYTQLAAYQPAVTTRVHAGDGSLLAEYSKERRLYVPIQTMPRLVVNAFVSAEDKNFYHHIGVDPEGIIRAAVTNLTRGRRQGASTITQQVAKNFLLSSEQTFDRKIKEMLVALKIETAYSKERILELYLNEIYLGLGNYGVAAASLNYFGKSVNELTLPEAAYLAALPKAPNNYHPFRKTQAAIERRNYVIDRMVENGYATKVEGDAAKAMPLGVTLRAVSPNTISAGFFAEEVRRELFDRYGEKSLYEGGLSVRTTLDPKLQQIARQTLADGLVRFDEAHDGFHGVVQKIDTQNADWGLTLSAIPAVTDVKNWRLAVVLGINGDTVQIGIQPQKDSAGQIGRDRETGVLLGGDALKWARKPIKQLLSPGDVIYVEPTDKAGQFRLRQVPDVSGALIAMDPYTGRVLAMVGGFSFDLSKFNRATQAQRQPGSSFKPFVYAAAIDNGYTPSDLMLDAPIEIDLGPGQEIWKPENFDKESHGLRTLRYGIEHSKNQMTVRLAQDIGMPLIANYAQKFGVYNNLPPYIAMSLGAGETTVLKVTTGYSMFVNGGRKITPTLIDRIQDRWGKTIYRHDVRQCVDCNTADWKSQPEPNVVDPREQIIDPLTAYQVVSMLEGVVQRGTGASIAAVGKPLAGKTGTTNNAKDLWFVGFSPDLAVGVYMGYDKPKSLGSQAQASQFTAPIFRDFMKLALADKPATPFRVPAGIKLVPIDPETGIRAQPGARGSIIEAYKPGTGPSEAITGDSLSGADVFVPTPDVEKAIGTGLGGVY